MTNPPYARDLLPQLVEHWLAQLEPVGGMLCLLLLAQWGESASGQALTTQHPAYAGRVRLPRRIRWFPKKAGDSSPQHSHCWVVWDWARDQTQMPFDVSVGDPRLMGRAIGDAGSTARGALKTATIPHGLPPKRPLGVPTPSGAQSTPKPCCDRQAEHPWRVHHDA